MAIKAKNVEEPTLEAKVAILEKRVADLEEKQRNHDEACPYKQACK